MSEQARPGGEEPPGENFWEEKFLKECRARKEERKRAGLVQPNEIRFKQIIGDENIGLYGLTEDGRIFSHNWDKDDRRFYWEPVPMMIKPKESNP